MKFRIEEDSLGKVRVPRNALWGAQTQRAIENFPISGISMNFPFTNTFISMLGYVKDAAARANKNLMLLEAKKKYSTDYKKPAADLYILYFFLLLKQKNNTNT